MSLVHHLRVNIHGDKAGSDKHKNSVRGSWTNSVQQSFRSKQLAMRAFDCAVSGRRENSADEQFF